MLPGHFPPRRKPGRGGLQRQETKSIESLCTARNALGCSLSSSATWDRASTGAIWHSFNVTVGIGAGAAYDRDFFEAQIVESRRSAQVIVPMMLGLLPITSVLDIGAGVGTWGATFLSNGVGDVTCVDGDYVDRTQLLVPIEQFRAHDLDQPLDLGRQFDLVVCLEVAEHLRAESASVLVSSLARHGDLILFSAGLPFQGGTNHVNEQWPSYWARHFVDVGFEVFDVVRPRIWDEERVVYWYRQNLLIFARGAAAEEVRVLRHEPAPIDIVHPEAWLIRSESHNSVRSIRGSLNDVKSAVLRRWRR